MNVPPFLESVIIVAGIAVGVYSVNIIGKMARKLHTRLLPMRLHSRYCHCDRCMDIESEAYERERMTNE